MEEEDTAELPCVECDLKASYYCVDCDNFYFCTICFNKIHSFNIFKRHVKQPIELSPRKQSPVKQKVLDLEKQLVSKSSASEENINISNKESDRLPSTDREKVEVENNVSREKEKGINIEEFRKDNVDIQNKVKQANDVMILIKTPSKAICEEPNISLNILCEEAAKRQAESKYYEIKTKKKLFTEVGHKQQNMINSTNEELNEERVDRQNEHKCVEEVRVDKQAYSEVLSDRPQQDEELVIGWQSYNERINEEKKYIGREKVTVLKNCAEDDREMLKQEKGRDFINIEKEQIEKMRSKTKYVEVPVKKTPYSQNVGKDPNKSKIKAEVKSAKQQYEELMEEIEEEKQKNNKREEEIRIRNEIRHKKQNKLKTKEAATIKTQSPCTPKQAEECEESRNEPANIIEIQKYNEEKVNGKNVLKNEGTVNPHGNNPYVEDGCKGQYITICEEVAVICSESNDEESVEGECEFENDKDAMTVSSEEQDEWRYTMQNEELAILEEHINSQIILNRNRLKNVSTEQYVEMLKKEQELKGRRIKGEEGVLFVHVPITGQRDNRQKRKLELRVVLEKLPQNEERVFAENRPNEAELSPAKKRQNIADNSFKRKVIKQEKNELFSEEDERTKDTKLAKLRPSSRPPNKYTPHTYTRTRRSKRKLKKRLTLQSKPKLKAVDILKRCATCEKSFKHKGDLVKHIRTHTGEKPYKCNQCHKAFPQRGHLATHERIHTGVRPHACLYCKSTFTQKIHMMEHLRSHTGERPYSCQHCEKRFMKKTHLNEHTRIHTGYKPYQCPYCEKCFCLSINYKNHIRIHTGELAYRCTVCPKRFNLRSDLVRHNRIHTGEKPYHCAVCKFPFSLKANLKKHVKNQHTLEEIDRMLANS